MDNIVQNNQRNGCFCVGYGFVPIQRLTDTFDAQKALCCGTLFPELSLSIDEYGVICKQEGVI